MRCIDDFYNVLLELEDYRNQGELTMLKNYCGSFVHFVTEYLLQDDQKDIKIIFSAIKAIRLVLKYNDMEIDEHLIKVLQGRINFRKLLEALADLLNDPKEVVRNEIQLLIIYISKFMAPKNLVTLLIQQLEYPRYMEHGKQHLLNIVTLILLKHNEDLKLKQRKEPVFQEIPQWGETAEAGVGREELQIYNKD